MYINKAFADTLKQSKLLIALLLIGILLISVSCSTSRKVYHPQKHKKKDCDCSQWSYDSSRGGGLKVI